MTKDEFGGVMVLIVLILGAMALLGVMVYRIYTNIQEANNQQLKYEICMDNVPEGEEHDGDRYRCERYLK